MKACMKIFLLLIMIILCLTGVAFAQVVISHDTDVVVSVPSDSRIAELCFHVYDTPGGVDIQNPHSCQPQTLVSNGELVRSMNDFSLSHGDQRYLMVTVKDAQGRSGPGGLERFFEWNTNPLPAITDFQFRITLTVPGQ